MHDTRPDPEPATPRQWLRGLRREVEERAARIAPLAGPIRRAQRPWSRTLDVLEAAEQEHPV